jgi:hypothetical protein
MKITLDSTGVAAVDKEYHWLPMSTCPLHTKVQLKGKGGLAIYSEYDGKDPFWVGWARLPTDKKENTNE